MVVSSILNLATTMFSVASMTPLSKMIIVAFIVLSVVLVPWISLVPG